MDSFIKHGLKIYFKDINLNLTDINDVFYYNKLICTINDFIKGSYILKIFILKDSTASVLQHLFKWIGIKNKNSLKMCNLDGGNVWSDTYIKIIDFFAKDESIDKYFLNRKYLKKSIMTAFYNVTYYTAWDDYLDLIKNENYNAEQLNSIKIFFKKFFNYLNTNFETSILYERKRDELWEEKLNIDFSDGSKLDFRYYKKINRRYEVKNQSLNLRGSITETIRMGEGKNNSLDKVRTKRSLAANLIHATDSYLARKVLNTYNIHIVHDEFLINVQEVCFLIDDINKMFSEIIKEGSFLKLKNIFLIDNCFSNFIIL